MFTDEQDIERQLKAELSVVPSGGFDAAVRRRIRQERSARPAHLPAWLTAAAAVLLALGGWYLMGRPEPVPAREVKTEARPDVWLPAAPAPPTVQAHSPSAPATVRRAARPHPRQTARAAEPEVIVPPGQLDAVRRLVRQVNAGRPVIPEPTAPAAEIEPMGVPLIVIEPIPVSTLAPGNSRERTKGLQ